MLVAIHAAVALFSVSLAVPGGCLHSTLSCRNLCAERAALEPGVHPGEWSGSPSLREQGLVPQSGSPSPREQGLVLLCRPCSEPRLLPCPRVLAVMAPVLLPGAHEVPSCLRSLTRQQCGTEHHEPLPMRVRKDLGCHLFSSCSLFPEPS